MIINLISSPRNISTALMYSFANRGDIKVIDEPLYAHYLFHTNVVHPGRDEIINSQSTDAEEVYDQILESEKEYGVVFVKNMAHHMIALDVDKYRKCKNLFLIRDPREIIASYSKVISNPTMQDIGCEKQFRIYENFEDGYKWVVDSNEILKNPEKMLTKICTLLDIPFKKEMVKWKKGPLPEDGVWSKYWYNAVHNSTGFHEYQRKEIHLSKRNMELYIESLPYFTSLKKNQIMA